MSQKTRIQYHRKKSGKTNYRKRLELLKNRTTRLVIRRSNKYLIAQIVAYEPSGDKVLIGTTSKELLKQGWKHSCKNIPASYLAGMMLGKKAQEKKIKKAILDLGLQTPAKGSKIYSLLKGAIDAGLEVPASDSIFPSEERIQGKHLSEKVNKDFEAIKKKLI